MKILEQSVELLSITPEAEKLIEKAGRTCYKSEEKITNASAEQFIRNIIKRGHESVIEHASATFRIICDRGTSHQIVRHRLASYSQESTRYIDYGNKGGEISVIKPYGIQESTENYDIWVNSCKQDEQNYMHLVSTGTPPQFARSVLPTCTKTEIVMTMNFRNWRHFLKTRLDKHAQPEIRILAAAIYDELYKNAPTCFEDLADIRKTIEEL